MELEMGCGIIALPSCSPVTAGSCGLSTVGSGSDGEGPDRNPGEERQRFLSLCCVAQFSCNLEKDIHSQL